MLSGDAQIINRSAAYHAEIECIPTCLETGEEPRYGPVLAGEYLVERFTSAFNQVEISSIRMK